MIDEPVEETSKDSIASGQAIQARSRSRSAVPSAMTEEMPLDVEAMGEMQNESEIAVVSSANRTPNSMYSTLMSSIQGP